MGAFSVVAAVVVRVGDQVGVISLGAHGCAQIGSLAASRDPGTGETDMKPTKTVVCVKYCMKWCILG